MKGDLATSRRAAVDAFLERNRQMLAADGCARLIFALDATISRQPAWDLACQLQAEMFHEAAAIGELGIQLVYYRGVDECRASSWFSDTQALASVMSRISCRAGHTQIGKVLAHSRREHAAHPIRGLVFVGDAMEEKEETLFAIARELGSRQLPVFLFQEDDDPEVSRVFAEIARLTKGAHCHFTPGAARELAELLRAVAAYAAGGLKALSASQSAGAVKLLLQLK